MTIRITTAEAVESRIVELCRVFKLPTVAAELCERVNNAGFPDALRIVAEVFEDESDDRLNRRINRLRLASHLPAAKTFDTLIEARLPPKLAAQMRQLARGTFADEATNVLAFGLPGTGKSHAAAAIGHALIQAGRTVYFSPTFKLVQELLAAKKNLELPKALRKLDNYDLLILDDIGYVQQSEDEVEVLFTLLAERYERKSILITSNLVFSEWNRIFKNPMTTAAAIDRLVHHCVILEFNVTSFRVEARSRDTRHNDNYDAQGDSPAVNTERSSDNYKEANDNYKPKQKKGAKAAKQARKSRPARPARIVVADRQK